MSEYDQNTQSQTESDVVRSEPQAVAGFSNDDLNLAMLAHLLGVITGFLGALVIWLMNKDKAGKEFVNEQAKEALNFQITLLLGYIVSMILSLILIGLLLFMILLVAGFVLSILAAMSARKGQAYRYPFTLRLIK